MLTDHYLDHSNLVPRIKILGIHIGFPPNYLVAVAGSILGTDFSARDGGRFLLPWQLLQRIEIYFYCDDLSGYLAGTRSA